jgi:hypothetical protein
MPRPIQHPVKAHRQKEIALCLSPRYYMGDIALSPCDTWAAGGVKTLLANSESGTVNDRVSWPEIREENYDNNHEDMD